MTKREPLHSASNKNHVIGYDDHSRGTLQRVCASLIELASSMIGPTASKSNLSKASRGRSKSRWTRTISDVSSWLFHRRVLLILVAGTSFFSVVNNTLALMPQRTYLCFFIAHDVALPTRGRLIAKEAANDLKHITSAEVCIYGHANERGNDKEANRLLSIQRAVAVKQALVRDGVPDDDFEVVGLADSELLNPSKPFDWQNQYVEIVFKNIASSC